jgi:hypothetical protein
MEDVRNWRDYPIQSKKDCVDFGKWLLSQSLLFTPELTENDEELWDTQEGEWLTVEQLYNKYINE